MTHEAVEKVQNWPFPKCTKEVESFLGFANYYRDHIKGFAEVTARLYQLTGSKATFQWKKEHDQDFRKLKLLLSEAPLLAFPNSDNLFVLDTDASDTAIGGVLSQIQDGTEKVISYGSFVLTPAQRRYCTTRKELLSVIRTDQNSLIWLIKFKNIKGQLSRWLEELSQYDINIVHRPGVHHGNADGLSRIPDDAPYCEHYESGTDLKSLPCGGCKFCTRAHSQWSRFDAAVDNVIPLTIHSVQVNTGYTTTESIENYSKQQLRISIERPEYRTIDKLERTE